MHIALIPERKAKACCPNLEAGPGLYVLMTCEEHVSNKSNNRDKPTIVFSESGICIIKHPLFYTPRLKPSGRFSAQSKLLLSSYSWLLQHVTMTGSPIPDTLTSAETRASDRSVNRVPRMRAMPHFLYPGVHYWVWHSERSIKVYGTELGTYTDFRGQATQHHGPEINDSPFYVHSIYHGSKLNCSNFQHIFS